MFFVYSVYSNLRCRHVSLENIVCATVLPSSSQGYQCLLSTQDSQLSINAAEPAGLRLVDLANKKIIASVWCIVFVCGDYLVYVLLFFYNTTFVQSSRTNAITSFTDVVGRPEFVFAGTEGGHLEMVDKRTLKVEEAVFRPVINIWLYCE